MKSTGPGLALLATLALGVAPASAATPYTVSGTVDQTSGGSCVGPVCTSLRAAVANVPAGSTIQLGSGIYKLSGFLAIGKGLSIVGLSPAQTTIQQTKAGDGVIEASAGDLSVSQLTITGGRKHGVTGQDQAAGGIYTAGTSLSVDHVSITGNTATGYTGAAGTSQAGGNAIGGIQIDGDSTALKISNSSITNNTATGGTGASAVGSGDGDVGGVAYGAISDFAGAPTITNSVISGNVATGGNGGSAAGTDPGSSGGYSGQADGAIGVISQPSSTTLITGSTISNNKAIGGTGGTGNGTTQGGSGNTTYGAISGVGGTLKVIASTISGNSSAPAKGGSGSTQGSDGLAFGGGFGIDSGSLILINSTVFGNVISGDSEGGGIDMRSSTGTLTLGSDTIFGNSAQQGGNINAVSTQITLADTIIAGGVASPAYSPTANCSFDTVNVINLGHNLEGTAPTRCSLSGPTTLVGINPQLASLANNGGLTQTMALGTASPALGAGGACTDIAVSASVALGVDQRGLPRAAACDIGAFQHQPVAEQAGPSITGSTSFRSTLTCSPGTWSGDGLYFQYQWSRGGRAIPGATGHMRLVTASDFGRQVSCVVTARGTYGSATASASVTMPVSCNCTPKFSKVSQSHRTWRRGTALARISARPKRPPVGTTFKFTLDRAGTVTLAFTRTSIGRIAHHHCVALTKSGRRAQTCTITRAAGSISLKAHAGVNRISFQGRLSRHKQLSTGSYLLAITGAVPGGPASRPSVLGFSVVS